MVKVLALYFILSAVMGTVFPALSDFENDNALRDDDKPELVPCTCGIFLSSQFKKGSPDPPEGSPALLQEINKVFACNQVGVRQCQSKCLEAIVPYLPTSHKILCASLDRDVHKERAYLFLQNCNSTWINTNMAAGKEYCCKDGQSVTCPKL